MTGPFGQDTLALLGDFRRALNEIRAEVRRITVYTNAAKFWENYAGKLDDSAVLMQRFRVDMEGATKWNAGESAAAKAFYDLIDAGIGSVNRWQQGNPAAVAAAFRDVETVLRDEAPKIEEYLGELTALEKVDGREEKVVSNEILTTYPKISEQDVQRGSVKVLAPVAADIERIQTAAFNLRDQIEKRFEAVKGKLVSLPATEQWSGPAGDVPRTNRTDPGGPSGPGGGPGGGPSGPGGPGGDKPGETPGGPESPQSTPDTGTPDTGTPSGGPSPTGDDPTAGEPEIPAPTPAPLTSDPELAGTPSATLNPASNPTLNPLPSNSPSIPPTGPPGSNLSTSPVPSVPFTPVSTARPPGRSNSTVDGLRGTVPGTSVPAAAEQQVRPRGGTPAGGTSGTGQGFYPPMMPMYPPGGGGGGSGIRPGEAEFAGGPIRHNGGRESWRAGLRPQLLGRADERDDEPPPVQQFSSGEVLDEELWQVPGAAPATPPEPQQRRGRSWP